LSIAFVPGLSAHTFDTGAGRIRTGRGCAGSQPPEVYGHPLDFVDSPNEFGLPPFYELHVWLYKSNPNGMFNEWNPRVSCKYAQ
jgi:hypothetical protein